MMAAVTSPWKHKRDAFYTMLDSSSNAEPCTLDAGGGAEVMDADPCNDAGDTSHTTRQRWPFRVATPFTTWDDSPRADT